jgi:hypothetical protein
MGDAYVSMLEASCANSAVSRPNKLLDEAWQPASFDLDRAGCSVLAALEENGCLRKRGCFYFAIIKEVCYGRAGLAEGFD